MSRGFRVWDVEAEEYLPNSNGTGDGVLGISADGKNVIWLEDGEATFFEDGRSVIIERSTGLKDKNGKEICEGDIVNYADECTCVVQYEDEGARFIHRDLLDDFPFGFNSFEKYSEKLLEVIGNIHKNPELLEVKNE